MEGTDINFNETDSIKFLNKLNILWYLSSMSEIWIWNVKLSRNWKIIHKIYSKIINYFLIFFVPFNAGVFITQHNLDIEQKYDSLVSAVLSSLFELYRIVLVYYRKEVKQLFIDLLVTLREYNNINIEQKMLRKIKICSYLYTFGSIGTMVFKAVKGGFNLYRGGNFTAFITMWPDINDPSMLAETVRYMIYFFWNFLGIRGCGVMCMITIALIIMSHQYMNLTRYFYELNKIFLDDGKDQNEKEREFEKALIKGVKWHVMMLSCVGRYQIVCTLIFNAHMFFLPMLLTILLPEMMKKDAMKEVMIAQLFLVLAGLFVLGLLMWNAGDVTWEASKLPEGIYGSGWENCHGRSKVRVRKIIVNILILAQQPVVFKAFGTVELSYASYVSIVKMSYSFFSLVAI